MGAKNIYSKVAVGGTMTDVDSSYSKVFGGLLTVDSLVSPYNFQTNGGMSTDFSLDNTIDFGHFEWIANHVVPSEEGDYKVILKTTGGTFSTADFRGADGQGSDNGKTLVVFNTQEDIILTATDSGRQFGPSVIAPFAKVKLDGAAGYVDGFIVAKSFATTGDNQSGLQMHGNGFSGLLACEVPVVETTPVASPVAVPAPVPAPVAAPVSEPVTTDEIRGAPEFEPASGPSGGSTCECMDNFESKPAGDYNVRTIVYDLLGGLDVSFRDVIVGSSSYTDAALVMIGEDTLEVNGETVYVNADPVTLPTTVGGYPVSMSTLIGNRKAVTVEIGAGALVFRVATFSDNRAHVQVVAR